MSRIAELEFTLTPDEMQQMLGMTDFSRHRRARQHPPRSAGGGGGALRVRFSAMLSPEGQLAMSQALHDTKVLLKHLATHGDTCSDITTRDSTSHHPNRQHRNHHHNHKHNNNHHLHSLQDRHRDSQTTGKEGHQPRGGGGPPRQPSAGLAEIFERLGTPRMTEDITDDVEDAFSTSPGHIHVRGVDGGRKHNATEIVEVFDYDRSQLHGIDDAAIEEIAKRNSVEKCKVWIEAHTENEDEQEEEEKEDGCDGHPHSQRLEEPS